MYSLPSYFLWFLGMCDIQVKNHKPISHPRMTSLFSFDAVLSVPANFSPEYPTKFFLRKMKMMFQVFRVLFHLHFTVKYFAFRVSAGYELYLLIGSPTVKL